MEICKSDSQCLSAGLVTEVDKAKVEPLAGLCVLHLQAKVPPVNSTEGSNYSSCVCVYMCLHNNGMVLKRARGYVYLIKE